MTPGEHDLAVLLRDMSPVLDPRRWVFTSWPADAVPGGVQPFAVVHEDEGVTLVLDADDAARLGAAASAPYARITLRVHSALEAVGLTAAVSAALAAAGLPCNVVAGAFHDHLLVPAERADEALRVLERLAG